jgi:uncharacterized protein (DUF362 family)
MNRREFIPLAGAGLLAGFAGWNGGRKVAVQDLPNPSVAILKAASYSDDLVARILQGAKACGLEVTGKNVLLKPDLVELDPTFCINTHPSVVAGAFAAFQQMGAASVVIGDGPQYHRDTYWLAEMADYRTKIKDFDDVFVDLNRDDVTPVQGFADREQIYLPNTALRADLVVSLAKMKTHYRTGMAGAMQNLFGIVPGSIYGWPKNDLTQVGLGESAFELARIFRRSFAIVDGIIGMEGNGPIQGKARQTGVLVMGSDLPSVDATCARIMGLDPTKLESLSMAADRIGVIDAERIEQRVEKLKDVQANFQLLPQHEQYRLT